MYACIHVYIHACICDDLCPTTPYVYRCAQYFLAEPLIYMYVCILFSGNIHPTNACMLILSKILVQLPWYNSTCVGVLNTGSPLTPIAVVQACMLPASGFLVPMPTCLLGFPTSLLHSMQCGWN